MIIKVVLIAGIALAAALMMRGPAHRQLALRRMFGISIAAVGVAAVAWPDLTTRAANLVGVGRGTDLVLYLAVLAFSFLSMALYQRIARLESNITQLTRELALTTPAQQTTDNLTTSGQVTRSA